MTSHNAAPRFATATPSPLAGAAPVVHIHGLSKHYGEQTVLQALDFTLQKGEFVALVGPSGTGKTTLLRIIGGLEQASSGRARIAEKTAIVFQDPRLILAQRVWKNVVLQDARKPGAQARALDALAEVGLANKAQAWPVSLSGGEAQRVGIARALYREPDLLLLDEPFSALDAFTRRKVQDLVVDLWQRHRPGVLLVTHDIEEAVLLADRVLVLGGGLVKADVPVTLPRKRDTTSAEFNAIKRRILEHLASAH
ncbi:ABC transporter ATP-binding protein [Pseudomonas typographi]|uniref:ABC transporter ATP-binding protein n=1 Tax=Pseudomonas typographi TaxID=2715964 RepID=A0ABR7YX22_9PSED|nr:ABC transporter ATP-binding protein [Pseudomonas typographi]MBD1551230.1 ABC transporter ATP-binding protein [Pseudomonas typographi]MBD1586276.1 ABC transporter ATP-binding protein [Pseudomonas typographi]MBD1597748.1 ABC transporter ATP-binding protein [Pseudomonas typographi]